MRAPQYLIIVFLCLSLLAGAWGASQVAGVQLAAYYAQQQERQGRVFGNAVWRMHRSAMLPQFADMQSLADSVELALFDADARSFIAGAEPYHAAVYHVSGQKILQLAGPELALPATMIPSVVAGKRAHQLYLSGINREQLSVSAIPLLHGDSVELVLVNAVDVSASHARLLWIFLALAVAGCAAIGVVALMSQSSVRRAEGLIARQYEENAELVAKATLANEENQQKSQFLANITHELRTPLNAIIGFSDILKNEFVPAPGQSNHTNYIHDIHSAGTHLLSLINDILDYSKAEAGKLELEVTEVNAVKIIQNCLRLVQPRAEMGQVKLLESLPKEPITLVTDSKKLKQILLNLLSNAVKFTPPEGTVKVHAWLDLREKSWVFEVSDSGIGMSQKDIPRALAPFGQIDNALSRKFEGTGLGLPLTKKFVELMGGRFAIESEPGKGTKVTFSLPLEFEAGEGVVVKQLL